MCSVPGLGLLRVSSVIDFLVVGVLDGMGFEFRVIQ
jgi:hypothetical protein